MVTLFVAILLLVCIVAAMLVCLGYRLGTRSTWQSEMLRVRLDGLQAQREIRDITRAAATSMVERVRHPRDTR